MRGKKHGTIRGHQEERYRPLLRTGQSRIASNAHGIGHCIKNETRCGGGCPENEAKHQGVWAPQLVDAVSKVGHQQRPQDVQNSYSYANDGSRGGHENPTPYHDDCRYQPPDSHTIGERGAQVFTSRFMMSRAHTPTLLKRSW